MTVGIIGIDPGGTTGVAWGWFNPALRDKSGLWVALARGRRTGFAELGERKAKSKDDIIKKGLIVSLAVADIIADWNLRGLGVDDVRVVIEDFQVRSGDRLTGGTAQDKLAPVFITGSLTGSLSVIGWGPVIQFVSPNVSKNLANDARLKHWAGLCRPRGSAGWVRGKPHARDAFRLIATGLEQTP